MGEDYLHGQPRTDLADLSSESGWVATDVAAKAVRVSPRTIRRYIDQGRLQAKQQGEGVRREWLVSVDSLHALLASRTVDEQRPPYDRAEHADTSAVSAADNIAGVIREMSARLERRAEEAAELRVRLELTERSQSTLEEERRLALQELEGERRRREEIERENEELRRELADLREPPESSTPPAEASEGAEPRSAAEGEHAATERPETEEEQPRRRSWWRRFFGFD